MTSLGRRSLGEAAAVYSRASLSCSSRCVPGRWATTGTTACERRVPTSGPTRSGSRARRSTSSTVCNATARRGTVKVMPPSTCSPGPATSRPGKFKVRTTPNGALPTHQDLVNIIRRGMPYTSMPAWPNLSDQEVSDLAYFTQDLLPRLLASPRMSPSPWNFRARRPPRASPSSSGRSSTRRTAA